MNQGAAGGGCVQLSARRPVRLIPSHHLYRAADSSWRLAGPGDTYERLRLAPAVGAALEGLLTGRVSAAAAAAQAGGESVLAGVLAALDQRGLLVPEPLAEHQPSATVLVLGVGAIALRMAELIGSAGHQVRRGDPAEPDAGELAAVDVVLACADWLPDAQWQELDARCAAARRAWHRCYREGTRYVLGPFSQPGRTASYRETRARRLAAARHPEELAAAWRHLDTRPPERIEPDAATSAVLAGMLSADLLAFLRRRPIPTEGCQLVIDPATMVVDRHVVLPLPVQVIAGWAAR